jgi:probable HAF family extracellular repeat protein
MAASFYSVQQIPFTPTDLNDRGDVVGGQYVWNSGNLTDLKSQLGVTNTTFAAKAINNSGQILGDGLVVSQPATDAPFTPTLSSDRVFLTDGKTVSQISLNASCVGYACPTTTAIDINDRGQILYGVQVPSGSFSQGQNPDGSKFTFNGGQLATGINNQSQIAGQRFGSGRSGPGVGIFEEEQTLVLTGTVYCPIPTDCFPRETVAKGINDRGQVVGYGPIDVAFSSPLRALFWADPKRHTVGQDLGTLGGSSGYFSFSSVANSINNSSQIVGYSYTPDGEQRAVIWEDGVLVDLNTQLPIEAGWTLSSATRINNAGQIIGTGLVNGQEQGYLLTPEPIPEPDGAIASFAGCSILLSVAGFKYRKQLR